MSDAPDGHQVDGIWDRLRRRKVIQWGFAYAAGAWALLQVLGFAADAFAWPSAVKQIAMLILLIGLAVALVLAWYHGDRVERVLRPLLPDREGTSVPKVHAGVSTATFVQPAGTAPTSIPEKSIAVLPFVDMSAERDQQYLGDGIAEELLNALASIEALKVAARTSSFSFAGKGASMKEIADTLHVRTVLEGSVRRSGQKLRITAQLIDVDTGFHLYSQSYDREVQDIFDIQNEIAREIVRALLPKLGLQQDATLIKQGTGNLEAYNLWLRAHRWVSNPDPKTFDAAIEQLQRAVTLDPSYGEAWGDFGYIYAYSATWARDPIPPLMKAFSSAERALALSPSNVSALLAQAAVSMLVHHDAATAARYYERVRVAGVDQSLWAFNKAYLLHGATGHFDDAIAELGDAERRDPLASPIKWLLIEMQLAAGQTTEALATAERLHQLVPRVPGSMAYEAYAFLATGDISRTEQLLAELRAATSDEFWHVSLIEFELCAATGRREAAQQLLAELLRKNAEGKTVSPFVIGAGYKALGEWARAIEWWERAVGQHHPHWPQMTTRFRCHPLIGKDPHFLEQLKRLRLDGDHGRTVAGE